VHMDSNAVTKSGTMVTLGGDSLTGVLEVIGTPIAAGDMVAG